MYRLIIKEKLRFTQPDNFMPILRFHGVFGILNSIAYGILRLSQLAGGGGGGGEFLPPTPENNVKLFD